MLELVAQSIASGIAIGCVYGLIGIGFCVIYNASGIVNFAQGAFVMLGGMVAYVMISRYGLPLPVAAIVSIAVGSVAGIALERLVVRPLGDRKSTMFVMILATLAAQISANSPEADSKTTGSVRAASCAGARRTSRVT